MSAGTGTRLDPITLEVIRNGLISVAREMGITLLRTSYSPILNEGKDFSTALFDRQGQMVAQMEGCPIHMASMGFSVKALLGRYPAKDIGPEDVFILNDPYNGGMQHNDITLIAPVFADGEPVVFVGVRAHHADAGGKAAGGFPADATEVFQEGIIIPPIKFVEDGVLRQDVLDLILANVRLRGSSIGDLQASQAAVAVGRRGVQRLFDRYGAATVDDAMQETLRYSEELVRAGLQRLPDGVYEHEDYVDNDGVSDDPFYVRVRITISGGEMEVDFEGSSPQVKGPLNTTYSLTCSAVGIGLLMTCDPNIPVNDGCLRPLTIKVPEGSVLNARHPAAVCGGSIETTCCVIDSIVAALAPAVPDRVGAGECGTCHATLMSGTYPADDSPFVLVLIPPGGWGGTAEHDGWTTTDEPVGNCMNVPVEYYELKYPVIVEEYALDPHSAGPGRKRGGHGHFQRVLCLTDLSLTTMGSRSTNPPGGLFGGWPGSTSAFWVATDDGVSRLRSKNASVGIPAGARFTTNPGGGGGYGDPRERAVEDVVRDVRNGFCTRVEARDIYGVALGEGLEVDVDETHGLRQLSAATAPSENGATRGQDWMQSVGGRRTLTPEMEEKARAVWLEGRL
jgi:N-methylhydantoinase B/oxoprolinase/acetone carboxylase alpha subunit